MDRAAAHDKAMIPSHRLVAMTNPEAQPVFFHPDYPAHMQPVEFAGRQASPRFSAPPSRTT